MVIESISSRDPSVLAQRRVVDHEKPQRAAVVHPDRLGASLEYLCVAMLGRKRGTRSASSAVMLRQTNLRAATKVQQMTSPGSSVSGPNAPSWNAKLRAVVNEMTNAPTAAGTRPKRMVPITMSISATSAITGRAQFAGTEEHERAACDDRRSARGAPPRRVP